MSLREKLTTILRKQKRRDLSNETGLESIERIVARVRSVDPETTTQWLRLQRTLESAPLRSASTPARWIPRVAFGGAVAATLFVGWYLFFRPSSGSAERFVTDRGEQLRVVLPDSSVVMLNYATELSVERFRPNQPRRLRLSGEALFTVRNNASPFIVTTDIAEVHVTGTEFNVRVRDGFAEVAVLRGSVLITAHDSALGLSAHQMAVCAEGGAPRHAGALPSPEYPGWLTGKLFLNRTPFAAACRELELRFAIDIRVDDVSLRNELVSGVLDVRTPQSAVAALCGLAGKQFRHDGQSYSIY